MLTDTKLKNIKPPEKPYKLKDGKIPGMYAYVTTQGVISFRLDYRLNGRRETLVLGKFGAGALTLAEARAEADRARKQITGGQSPSREKQTGKRRVRESKTFSQWTERYMADSNLAESTLNMKQSILDRDILPVFGKRRLDEIKATDLRALAERIKSRGAPATAIHAREIVLGVYKYAIARGEKVENPAEDVPAHTIATFKPRDRALSPDETGLFLRSLEATSTMPAIRLALRLILLTLVRKTELLAATWPEIDFKAALWTIPKERMKAKRPHLIPLSRQAVDVLITLKTIAGTSAYIVPSRYEAGKPLSGAALNRVITTVVDKAKADGLPLEHFTVHDLRRTGSTLLHEAGFNSDWIEKALAHEQRGVRAVYNKAEYLDQRRDMLQRWADMVDSWTAGAEVIPFRRAG